MFSAYKNKKYLQKLHLLEKNRKFVPYFALGISSNFVAIPEDENKIIKNNNYYAK